MNCISILLSICIFHFHLARSFPLKLQPGHFHIMMDTTTQHAALDETCLRNLQSAGVDSFLVDSVTSTHENSNFPMLFSHQCRPVVERSSWNRDVSSFQLWQVASTDTNNPPTRMSPTTDPKQEAFLLLGDDQFVVSTMNSRLPPGAHCLWKPPPGPQLLLLGSGTPIAVWRLRSSPGILGIVLDWNDAMADEDQLGGIAARLRKLRQPCSAMDYPPTIYMIGEDEQR
jgi:hypothetical protein